MSLTELMSNSEMTEMLLGKHWRRDLAVLTFSTLLSASQEYDKKRQEHLAGNFISAYKRQMFEKDSHTDADKHQAANRLYSVLENVTNRFADVNPQVRH